MKEDERHLVSSSQHLSNDAENFLSKDMIKYVEHAVDPKHAPVGLRPAPASQYTGLCQKLPVLCRGVFETGTTGIGSLSVSPSFNRGLGDRALAVFTNKDLTLTTSSPVPYQGIGIAGVSYAPPAKSPFLQSGLGTNDGDLLNVMTNACAVYVKPIGSATTQNGRIFLLEVPGHPGNGVGTLSFQDVMDHPRTRVIDAVQLGTPGFQNVLNWHPQSLAFQSASGHETDDNSFAAPGSLAVPTSFTNSELIVVVTGDATTKYEFEVYASFACRGRLTQPTVPMYTDPLGWAAYMNAVSDKRVSGWVGSASLASSIYKGFASKSIRAQQPKAVQELEKARARLDEEKARKSGQVHKTWYESMKDLAPVAKELGGFLLNFL